MTLRPIDTGDLCLNASALKSRYRKGSNGKNQDSPSHQSSNKLASHLLNRRSGCKSSILAPLEQVAQHNSVIFALSFDHPSKRLQSTRKAVDRQIYQQKLSGIQQSTHPYLLKQDRHRTRTHKYNHGVKKKLDVGKTIKQIPIQDQNSPKSVGKQQQLVQTTSQFKLRQNINKKPQGYSVNSVGSKLGLKSENSIPQSISNQKQYFPMISMTVKKRSPLQPKIAKAASYFRKRIKSLMLKKDSQVFLEGGQTIPKLVNIDFSSSFNGMLDPNQRKSLQFTFGSF